MKVLLKKAGFLVFATFLSTFSFASSKDCPEITCWSTFTKVLLHVGAYRSYESASKYPLSSFAQYDEDLREVRFGFYDDYNGEQSYATTASMKIEERSKTIHGRDHLGNPHTMACELTRVSPRGYYGCPAFP